MSDFIFTMEIHVIPDTISYTWNVLTHVDMAESGPRFAGTRSAPGFVLASLAENPVGIVVMGGSITPGAGEPNNDRCVLAAAR
jgi:hypothetical protein